jgi:5-methylcytosine-specific restriction endonuclease McrA
MAILPDPSPDSHPALKTCTECNEAKPPGDFYVKDRATGRLYSKCRACHCKRTAATLKRKYEADPEPFKEYSRRYRAENIDAVKAAASAKRKANLEEARRKDREQDAKRRDKRVAYRKANAARNNAFNKAYRQANRDKIRAKNAEYQVLHPDIYRMASRRWRLKNPELARFIKKRGDHKRRAILANAGTHTLAEWQAIKAKYDHRCLLCGLYEPFIKLTVDHIVPLSKGGMNTADNLQPLCMGCNQHKKTRDWDLRPKPKPRSRPGPARLAGRSSFA